MKSLPQQINHVIETILHNILDNPTALTLITEHPRPTNRQPSPPYSQRYPTADLYFSPKFQRHLKGHGEHLDFYFIKKNYLFK